MQVKKMINNIAFVVDESSSMIHLRDAVTSLFGKLIADVKSANAQENRVIVVRFSNTVMEPRSTLDGYYPRGSTALIDAVIETVRDFSEVKERKDEDHSYLIYVLTDGEENCSKNSPMKLQQVLNALPDNWTFAILVPNQTGVHHAKRFGFPAGNIEIWNTTSVKGFEDATDRVRSTFTQYTSDRAAGVRGTKNLFKVDANKVSAKEARENLVEIPGKLYPVQKEYQIRDFVEMATGKAYVKGQAFYELKKTEIVQANKEIVVVSKTTDKKFGGSDARDLLGIPSGTDIKLAPGNTGNWRVFVQSTSVNRKLAKGESVFVKAS